MITNLLIINPKEVVDMAFVPKENFDYTQIRHSKIIVAQEYFIKPLLGDKLFDRLMAPELECFRNLYIKPALAHYIRSAVIAENAIRISENGVDIALTEKAKTDNRDKKTLAKDSTTISGRNQTQDTVTNKTLKTDKTTGEKITATENSTSNDTVKLDAVETHSTTQIDSNNKDSDINQIKTALQSDDSNKTSQINRTNVTTTGALNENTISNDSSSKQINDTISTTKSDKISGNSTKTLDKSSTQNNLINKSANITKSNDKNIIVADNTTTNDVANTTIDQSQNSTQHDSSTNEQINSSVNDKVIRKPASDKQRQIIINKALFDANVLMDRAIRYVNNNKEFFMDYEPYSGMNRFRTRCRIVL